jgi:16S rRNA (uracil1498-N3)-methyltransferase
MHKHEQSYFFIEGVIGDKARFSKEEIRHALLSFRMTEGALKATDGMGHVYECAIDADTADSGEVSIVSIAKPVRFSPDIHVYIGIPDRDAFEEVITGLAALGAARIIPLVCRYCQKNWWDEWDKHAERMKRKLIAGIKQSLNPWLPELTRPLPFNLMQSDVRARSLNKCLVADVLGAPLLDPLPALAAETSAACVIGPPGGFSPEEVEYLKAVGSIFVNIAPYRLRTELAAIVLCGAMAQARVP